MPEVSVLIPAYQGEGFLPGCLSSIPAAAETIVADNGSTDGTAALAEKLGVKVVRMGANKGFSAAVNEAARHAAGEVLVLLNQDVRLQPGALEVMHAFLTGRRALAGGRLLDPDGSPQPSCGPFPTLANTVARMVLPRAGRKYYLSRPRDKDRVDWATGAFLGCPRTVFEELGGLDEDFFMYYEDVDFCLRAARAGAPAFFLDDAVGTHSNPFAERRAAPDWLRRHVRRSQATFFRKHRPAPERAAVALLNRAYFACNGWTWDP